MRRRVGASVLVLCATAALITAAAPAASAQPAWPGQSARLAWGACPQPDPGRDPRQECATVRVPVDYRRRSGPTIDVWISRIRAARPDLRRGILLSNPGGPGGQGLDLPSELAAFLPAEVSDRFDLIGFDPRGVGYSAPVTCGMGPETPVDLQLPVPAPDGSIDRNVVFARETAAACDALSGDILRHISTANTARDMDAIRAALGEPKLSYFGLSYGTYLGAVYASLFPHRTDRIVLDSAVDPRRVWYDQWRTFAIGFAQRFGDFTAWAAARDDIYHLGSTPQAVNELYYAIAAALDEQPIPQPGSFPFNGNVFRLVTFSALYSDFFFPDLAGLWAALIQPGAQRSVPAAALAALTIRRPVPPEIPFDNLRAAQYAVICGDAAWSRDIAMYQRNVLADRARFPGTAGFPANLWPCVAWRHAPAEPPVAVTDHGPRNILVVQNLRDPATPWITGFGLRKVLGRRASLVTVDQGGHGATTTGAACPFDVATNFLLTGRLPVRDTFCPAEPAAATIGPNASRPVPRLIPPLW